jgi:hypothetical protein
MRGVVYGVQQYFSYIVAVSFIGGGNHRPAKVADKLKSHNVVLIHPTSVGFELTMQVMMGTDCIGSCKSNTYNHDCPSCIDVHLAMSDI